MRDRVYILHFNTTIYILHTYMQYNKIYLLAYVYISLHSYMQYNNIYLLAYICTVQ